MQPVIWIGTISNIESKETKSSGEIFPIVTVDGLEIPFFGFCKRSVRDYKVGDFVKILVVVSTYKNMPSVQGLSIGRDTASCSSIVSVG